MSNMSICECVCECVNASCLCVCVRACVCAFVGGRMCKVIIISSLFTVTIFIQRIHACIRYIVDIDECASNPCNQEYNMSCTNQLNDYTCECHTCNCSTITVTKDCNLGKFRFFWRAGTSKIWMQKREAIGNITLNHI